MVNILLVLCGRCTEAKSYFQLFYFIKINPYKCIKKKKVKKNQASKPLENEATIKITFQKVENKLKLQIIQGFVYSG